MSFRHKGLETFYRTGNKKGVRPEHAARLRRILTVLDEAADFDDLQHVNRPHMLKGEYEGFFAVSVSGNWRVIAQFTDSGDVELVDYLDYH